MKYYIQRGLNEYGPYTLADLQRYLASGNIQLTDLTRNEAMTEWVPVSQVIGNIPLPAPVPPAAPVYGSTPAAATGTPYGSVSAGAGQPSGTSSATGSGAAGAGVQPGPVYGAEGKDLFGGGPAAATSAEGTVYGGTAPGGLAHPGSLPAYGASTVAGPVPPDFHWALVLLIGFFCGFFQLVWLFVEASFVKKLRPDNNCIMFLVSGILTLFLAIFVVIGVSMQAANNPDAASPGFLIFCLFLLLAGTALHIVGVFKMRAGLVEYYNSVEPINLRLSGVMTFFFNVWYFQYHFSRIAAWKKTGYLVPQ